MDTKSQHILIELFECNKDTLNKLLSIQDLLEHAAITAQATIVKSVFHEFSPQGVTGVVIVEESHLSIHTWPEYGYASVDFYTCGECLPESAISVISEGLSAERVEVMLVERGLSLTQTAMNISYHRTT